MINRILETAARRMIPALIAVLALAGQVHGADWVLAYEETFKSPGWQTNWTLKGSVGALDKLALLGAGGELEARLNRSFAGQAFRVEYDAVMIEEGEQSVSDLSCFVGPAVFRLGGDNNTKTDIGGPGEFIPSGPAVLIEPKKIYHVVAEVNGRWCRLVVDGRLCGDLIMPKPLTEATIALYTWAGPSRFTNLKIFTRDQSDPVPGELLKKAAEKKASGQKAVIPAEKKATVPGELRVHATLHCIGIEWDIEGDSNYNATCAVQYRRKGRTEWSKAMPLLRVDYLGWYDKQRADRTYNMLAGSVLFLRPGATYEVQLTLADPDGGNKTEQRTISTHPVPALPSNGRTFHVVPGSGGGEGTEKDPFRGLKATLPVARPGDIFLVHKGDYGRFNMHSIGTASGLSETNEYIVWKSAGDGEALFSFIDVRVGNVWLEGFHVRGKGGNGLAASGKPANVVISRNRFAGFHYSIDLHGAGEGWYIADNVIVGDKDRATGKGYDVATGGEGVELGHTSGQVVCYNTISQTADGVSYPGRNCDIYGNDIFKVSDDGLEPDYGYANVRMWGNRIHSYMAGISFQPMYCPPWYLVRNQVIANHECFKMRVCDRFVMVNNTFIGPFGCNYAWRLQDCVSRNNIWYHSSPENYLWYAQYMKADDPSARYVNIPDEAGYGPSWKTDLDYDGFGGRTNQSGKFAGDLFYWYDPVTKRHEHFGRVTDFAKFAGIEQHGVQLADGQTFENYAIPEDLQKPYPRGELDQQLMTLQAKSAAVDAGAILPNIHDDWYAGKAPDLGAHERGFPPPHYGARDDKTMREHALYWVLKNERRD